MIGEPLIGLPETFSFPDFGDADRNPKLPVKTVLMLASLGTLVSVSAFHRKLLSRTGSNDEPEVAVAMNRK